MKNERILVTGSKGFIGSSLINKLSNLNISFFGVDKCATSIHEKVDLTDYSRMKSTFDKHKPSIIVHAGTNSVGAYSSDFIASYRNDSESLTNIMIFIYQTQICCAQIIFACLYFIVLMMSKHSTW